MLLDYNDYKKYLSNVLAKKHGQRAQMARALKCDPAFITRVLNGLPHFSLEQGDKINRFLGHSSIEARYFLAAINYSRAGTTSLQSFFSIEMDRIKKENTDLKNRFRSSQNEMPEEVQSLYYSNWIYAAIDSLVSSGICENPSEISTSLKIDINECYSRLQNLLDWGVLKKKGEKYFEGAVHIHLHNSSGNIAKHHTNWRLQGLKALEKSDTSNFHYSGVYSMSESDAIIIHQLLLNKVEEIVGIVRPSNPEKLVALGIDFFHV